MCQADQPIRFEKEFGIVGRDVYRFQTIQVPSGHIGGPPTEFRFLGGAPVGHRDPIQPNRAFVNGQVRPVIGFGGIA